MNRRLFVSSAAAAALRGAETKLLLPSDKPDEFHFRLMWYNPVPPIDQASYRLKVSGLVDKPVSLAVSDLCRFPQEAQNLESARMGEPQNRQKPPGAPTEAPAWACGCREAGGAIPNPADSPVAGTDVGP